MDLLSKDGWAFFHPFNMTEANNGSHLNAHMESVIGHRHGVWDYLHTGELPPLRPATTPLPLHERVLDDEIPMNKRRRSM